jgi:hypothetical protein
MDGRRRIADDELKDLLHPSEQSRLVLALVGLVPIALFALAVIVLSRGFMLLFVGSVLGTIWLAMRLQEARLKGQAVEVQGENFPELRAVLRDVCQQLDYGKPVSMFVVNEGTVNATLLRLFGKRILWVNAGLVEAMGDPETRAELEFVVGRFVGALKSRHLRFGELTMIISGFERLAGLNLLILPYMRATILSGDQIGMMISGDATASLRAMSKLFIGNALADRLSLRATVEQAVRQRYSPFRWLAIAFSSHPHMTDRILNLVRFSQSRVATDEYGLAGGAEPSLVAAAGRIRTPQLV